MNVVRFEDTVRRRAGRVQGAVAHLIDDGSDVVREKLEEAADLIRGAASQLFEDSQALIHARLNEAADLAQQTRKQAKAASREAIKTASATTQDVYGDLQALAGRKPLAIAAAALGIGVVLGLVLRTRRADQAALPSARPQPAAKTSAARKAAPAKASVRPKREPPVKSKGINGPAPQA